MVIALAPNQIALKLVELEMTRLSAEIRRKPSWWTKFRDPEILARWKAEALAQAELMSESHVDYVLKELDGYANLRDEESGAEVCPIADYIFTIP